MGRAFNTFGRSALVAVAAFGLLSVTGVSESGAEAAAQSYPIISLQTPLARDAQTQDQDLSLLKACTADGADQAVCLCVTHILKYELTLSEYKASARLYGQPKDRKLLHRALRDDGFSASDIATAEMMERDLIQDADFGLRCAEAKAYYRETGKPRKNRVKSRG